MTPSLEELFAELATPGGPGIYSAVPIPAASSYRLARAFEGYPTLLIDVAEIPGATSLVDLRGQHIIVHHGRRCEVRAPDAVPFVGTFSLICCVSDEAALQGYFLDFLYTLVRMLGERPTAEIISESMNHLLELFAALRQSPTTTAQGAWTELLLIAEAQNPAAMAAAWHTSPTETYDFNAGAQRIEAKSSSRGIRRHHFTFDQLTPPEGVELLIASVLVERTGGGASIRDLLQRIRTTLAANPGLLQHVEATLAQTLGSALLDAFDQSYDRELALDSLRFYRFDEVPRLTGPFPPGVSGVAFTSDLSSTTCLDSERMLSRGGLFMSAPRTGAS